MGGKSSAPAPPNYSPIAESSMAAAKLQQQTAREQLDWAREQYKDQAPRTNEYMDSMTRATDAQTKSAELDRSRYESMYQPTEDRLIGTANAYNSSVGAEQKSQQAMGDVAQSFESARNASLAHLESFGMKPGDTRMSALDIGTRVSEAAAQAGAATASRRGSETTGLALQGEGINIGKGYPGQVAQSYAGGTASGGAGISSGLNTSSTYGNLMGTGVQYSGLALTNRTVGVAGMQQGNAFANQAAGINNQAATGMGSAIGSAIGGAGAAASLYSNFSTAMK